MKGDKLSDIKCYVADHPGSTSHEICRGLRCLSYLSLIYYAAKKGYIRAERDERFKRLNVYFPADCENPACSMGGIK
jgi:hypothetical protein